MATIAGAITAKVLAEFALPEYEGRDPRRPLYVATELFDWIDDTEALYDENWSKQSGGRSIFEHLEQAFCDFRCDEHPLVGDLRRVIPTKHGVWKINMPGLRIFGWVPDRYRFVAVRAAFSDNTHGPESEVDDHVRAVIEFAKRHELHHTFKAGDHIALFS